MAHFAKLNSNSEVVEVHVVNNDVITDANGQEQEQLGIDFLNNLHKTPNDIVFGKNPQLAFMETNFL